MSTTPAAPAARTPYITRDQLADLVGEYRRSGRVSEQLGAALVQIAAGVFDRYQFVPDKDDCVQEIVLHLMQRPLEKADLQKHLFNYLTTCAIRFGWKLRDKQYGDRRRFETYAAELLESGRDLPDSDEGRDVYDVPDVAHGNTPVLPTSRLGRAARRRG
jgi:hypothetical protein